jgi:hypothetical protein
VDAHRHDPHREAGLEVVLGAQRGNGVHEVLVVCRPGLRGVGDRRQVVAGEQAADVAGIGARFRIGASASCLPTPPNPPPPGEMGVRFLRRRGHCSQNRSFSATVGGSLEMAVECQLSATVSEGDL